MSDHDHEWGPVQVFDEEAQLVGEGEACRICGESNPDHPVPTIETIEDAE